MLDWDFWRLRLMHKNTMPDYWQHETFRVHYCHPTPPPPKRPIYYCQYEMQFLPYKSRDILRDMGDFVDMLVKAAVYERTNSTKVFDRTLAQTINEFEKHLSSHPQLLRWLGEYNQFLFAPKAASERIRYHNHHRFTVRETVLAIFVSMHLADKITAISRMAELVRRDKPMRT